MTVETIAPRDHAHWLSLRAGDVTSTESAALFGLSPYLTAFELWHRKRRADPGSITTNERMRWGNRLESAIAEAAAEERGWLIEPLKTYRRLPAERIGSSFDYLIRSDTDGQPALLECKNVDYLAFRDGWIEHDDGSVEAPAQIEMQVQHQQLVAGIQRTYIAALIGGNRLVIIRRDGDAQVQRAIRHRIREFWRTVDAGQEPPPVMPEDADAAIRLQAHAEPGKQIDARDDAKIATLVAAYREASAAAANADEAKKVAKAELLAAIGDAERVIGDGWTLSAGLVSDVPPTVITADMVGRTYGGRAGYRNLRLNVKGKK